MYYTYIIKSCKDGTFYIGCTENVVERLKKHNSGATTYTRKKRPWSLVYKEEFSTKKEALRREKQLKNFKSHKYIETIIKNNGAVAQW